MATPCLQSPRTLALGTATAGPPFLPLPPPPRIHFAQFHALAITPSRVVPWGTPRRGGPLVTPHSLPLPLAWGALTNPSLPAPPPPLPPGLFATPPCPWSHAWMTWFSALLSLRLGHCSLLARALPYLVWVCPCSCGGRMLCMALQIMPSAAAPQEGAPPPGQLGLHWGQAGMPRPGESWVPPLGLSSGLTTIWSGEPMQ